LSNNIATISGTPAGTATGTFNYSLTVSGSATSQIVTGTITVNSPPPNISFDGNGTCNCANATVGDTATISGTLYTVVDNSTIAGQIANGNYNLCTTLATYMTELFVDNTSFNSDISFWDMSNVTNTDRMFQGASSFNQDIGGWNTSKFYDVSGMFKSASNFNQNIGSWDTSRVANMSSMFNYASSFNQDLTGWCVSNISSEPGAFAANTSALTNTNKPIWGKEFTIALTSGSQTQTVTATTAITPIQYSLSSICTTTLSISASNLPSGVSAALSNNIATISGTPAGTATGTFNYSLTVSGSTTGQTVTGTIVVSPVATSSTTSSSISFDSNGTCNCAGATVGDTATISGTLYTVVDNSTIAGQIANGNYNLCTTLATYMTELFVDNTSFNSDISFWDMSNVTNTDRMFQGASSFNQDIGGWNTSKFYDVSGMFKSASNFNQNIGSWDTSRVANMSSMFNYASSFNQDLTGWCVSNISSEPGAFAANTSALTNTNKPLWGYCPASFSLDVTASNSSDYTLSGTDRNGNISGSDPNLTFSVGDTISFVVNASGHPFYLKTVAGTGTGDTISGLTNNGTESATISWTPTATGTFYYQCSLHGGMVGTITIQ